MDILDNIIFASYNRTLTGNRTIQGDYVDKPAEPTPVLTNAGAAAIWSYPVFEKLNFCAVEDPGLLERGIIRHWYDVDAQDTY